MLLQRKFCLIEYFTVFAWWLEFRAMLHGINENRSFDFDLNLLRLHKCNRFLMNSSDRSRAFESSNPLSWDCFRHCQFPEWQIRLSMWRLPMESQEFPKENKTKRKERRKSVKGISINVAQCYVVINASSIIKFLKVVIIEIFLKLFECLLIELLCLYHLKYV